MGTYILGHLLTIADQKSCPTMCTQTPDFPCLSDPTICITVSDVRKSVRRAKEDLLLILKLRVSRLRSSCLLQPVLPSTPPVDECQINQTCHPAADDGDFSGPVLRRILWSEGLGT
jgi:hypothetical protein